MIAEIDGAGLVLGMEIGRGRSARVYRLGADRVVKIFHGEGRRAALSEVRKTLAARAAGAPAVALEGLVEIGGRHGFVCEYVPGVPLNRLLARRPDRLLWAADVLAGIQQQIGAIAAPKGLPDGRRLIAHHLEARWLGTGTRRRFAAALPDIPVVEDRLCHGNLSTRNLIVHGSDIRVIDWGSAFAGPEMLDAALTLQFLASFTPSRRSTLPGRLLGRAMAHRFRHTILLGKAARVAELRAFEPFGALMRASALTDRPHFERDLIGFLDKCQAASAGAKRP